MTIGIATKLWDDWQKCVDSWDRTAFFPHRQIVVPNREILDAYQTIYQNTNDPVIGYIHDDVYIYEKGWDQRVLGEFNDPKVGLVGFGGALGHGTPNLYTVPYHLPNLARQHFMSNMRSAEMHGMRFPSKRDVAVLDGFALFVRRPILDTVGGWDMKATYFMYAEWLCCEVRRQGYRIRLVGVDCEHLGGRSSTAGLKDDYQEAHRYFYERNRDVMPYRIEE
jgi:GT2 family glycosyltransferase